MADEKRTKSAARPTVAQDKADHQASAHRVGPPGHSFPIAPPTSPHPMLEMDRERLAELRAKLPPVPEHRTFEEEEEMHILERRLEKAAQAEWAKQDARVLELQQNDHRTPEEEDELARLVREIDQQDRAVKRAESLPQTRSGGVKP